MKKGLFIVIVLCMCFVMVGCNEKKEEDNQLVGGWEIIKSDTVKDLSNEDINRFKNSAKEYTKEKLEVVALLGKQVVAGTNYMYLAKTDKEYKVVIVYTDLEGKSSITKVSNFDFVKYTNTNSDGLGEQLSGGWYAESKNNEYKLPDEKIQSMYESATSTLAGMEFKPLVLVGKQIVSGTNYAIVCYGQATVPNATTGIYLLTLYNTLEGTSELTGIAYIDLAQYNQ